MENSRISTLLCREDSSTSTLLTGLVPVEGVPGQFSLLPYFIEIHVSNANSVDPDQTPHSVLALHCLPMSL